MDKTLPHSVEPFDVQYYYTIPLHIKGLSIGQFNALNTNGLESCCWLCVREARSADSGIFFCSFC